MAHTYFYGKYNICFVGHVSLLRQEHSSTENPQKNESETNKCRQTPFSQDKDRYALTP